MKQFVSTLPARVMHVLVGLLVFVGYSLFTVPELTPELSEEVAIVVGLRPATGAFPGLWRQVTSFLPLNAFWLGLAGRICAAAFAVLLSLFLHQGLTLLFRLSAPRGKRSRWMVPAIASVTAVMASFADPVWRVFSLLTPAGLLLLIGLLAVYLFISCMSGGRKWRFCIAGLLVGLLAAETPLALLLGLVMIVVYFRLMKNMAFSAVLPEAEYVELGLFPLWRVTLLFFAGAVLGGAANVHAMSIRGGAGALGWNMSMLLLHYLSAYLDIIPAAASAIGYLLGFGLTVLPLVASVGLFLRLTDDDYRFPFRFGIVLLIMGFIAYFTQGPIRGLWFWTWVGDQGMVHSQLLLATFSTCASIATAFIGGIFAFDALNSERRNDRTRGVSFCYISAVAIVLALVTVGILPQMRHERMRKVLAFNGRAVRETVREMNGAKWIFTDGTADAAIELEARRQGTATYAINLMGAGNGRDGKLLLRGLTEQGDIETAVLGPSVLLRTWACDKENGLADVALQLGFDLWKRERKLKQPAASAFVARQQGLRDEDIDNAQEIAMRFTDEIMALTPIVNSQDVPPAVRREFFRHCWRLSRFARYRSDAPLADQLDACNSVLRMMMANIENERTRVFMMMTPKEGLELALKRTDFADATRYAATVLKLDENEPHANFAMGMYFLLGGKYVEAEPYLKKILERDPNEAVVLNNLSILCRKTHRLDEARQYADRALKIMPNSPEVKKTHRDAYESK